MNKYKILKDIPTAWVEHLVFAEWIVNKKKPETIVELGVDRGYSTFCFAMPGIGHVYGIDSFEGDICSGMRNTYDYVIEKRKELELDNITIIKGFTYDVASVWDKPIDILHIDALHTYEAVKNDFYNWLEFVKDDGVILLHDTMVDYPTFGVNKFFAEIDLPKTNFENCYGLGVVSRNSDIIEEIKSAFNLK